MGWDHKRNQRPGVVRCQRINGTALAFSDDKIPPNSCFNIHLCEKEFQRSVDNFFSSDPSFKNE
eukprot:768344-Hanusia_phi.AAC.2